MDCFGLEPEGIHVLRYVKRSAISGPLTSDEVQWVPVSRMSRVAAAAAAATAVFINPLLTTTASLLAQPVLALANPPV
jgi:hypothetical protein